MRTTLFDDLRIALEELVAERAPNGIHEDLPMTYGLELARQALARFTALPKTTNWKDYR